MKKSTVQLAAMAVLGLAAVSVPALAEDMERVRISVPFEFKAGSATLPAGTYTIVEANPGGLIRISGFKESAMMITHPGVQGGDAMEPTLEFRKTQDGNVLTEVRMSGHPSNVLAGTEK